MNRKLGSRNLARKPQNPPMLWKTPRLTLDLTHRAVVMGILNMTPDSFSDGGNYDCLPAALGHARLMISQGAEIVDIGGESTRPGAKKISVEEEIHRTQPVIAALRDEWQGLISIDTSKAEVAAAAISAGADIVNDVTGLRGDREMLCLCKRTGVGLVIMHMQGEPLTMQMAPAYDDVIATVREFFSERYATLASHGIDPLAMCFDAGFGFGKSFLHNRTLLCGLEELVVEGRPLLLGASRKSFLATFLKRHGQEGNVASRDAATAAVTSYARAKGAMVHRVHDVLANVTALRIYEELHTG